MRNVINVTSDCITRSTMGRMGNIVFALHTFDATV